MALKECKECKKEISTQADACPHCGAKPFKFKPYKPSGCFIVILVGLGAIAFAGLYPNAPSAPTSTQMPVEPAFSAASANGACRSYIEQTLHDPDSADFATTSESYVNRGADGVWVVQRKVRAANAFGAKRLSIFECRMKEAGDSFMLISVKQLGD